jgi:hypothetical protein
LFDGQPIHDAWVELGRCVSNQAKEIRIHVSLTLLC